ncbi:hypothetical protein C2845_PM01G42940 [Panicum miliaceum]|uniref:NAC domain-containing protein n=1 Tax=Panicum miliaceum TaxID=4540 RepID=A0A3L6TIB2_PANMI|nr:hypothetical protein C2845_PM01G42940 [Panicum miliaceum]
MAAADGSLTKHGFPRGYRFVPTSLELISILSDQIRGCTLPPPLHTIFHDVRILDYHPEELYERFKDVAEHRYIYFFSVREFQKPGAGASVPEDKDQKEPRPVRVARGGGWKPSGGGQVLRWPRKKGGFVAGRMVTMVFYDRVDGGDGVKSNWGMHEFLVPVHPRLTSLTDNKYIRVSIPLPSYCQFVTQKYYTPISASKTQKFYDLALYRLYILKSGDMESENGAGSSSSSQQMMPNAYDDFPESPAAVLPCPTLQPWGISTGNYHQPPLAAGASTSQILPPPQHPSLEHAQYYPYQQQHTFGAAAAAPQAHTMHGAELPGNMHQYQLAIPPAPAPVPTAAANAAEAQQAPAMETHGAGQDEAGPSGATRSPSPPPVAASPPAEPHAAAAATEPGHVQFADCVKPMEAAAAAPTLEDVMPPAAKDEPMVDAEDYSDLGMPDWNNFDLMPLDESYLEFTIDEILGLPAFDDEPPAMEGDGSSSGGENYSQAEADGGTKEPPAALGCC